MDAEAIQKLVYAPVAGRLEVLEGWLVGELEARGDLIGTVGNYVLSAGGKRVRPALLLLCAQACGYAGGERDVTLAAVAEWMHVATLMHDDIIDDADKRRGRPSANATWGPHVSVLVGDFLYARSIQILVADGHPGVLDTFADATVRMAEAQVLEHELKGKLDISVEAYLRIIAGKTAALIAAACRTGALIAGVGPAVATAVTAFGRDLGIGFQLVDDALDYVAREERLGKPVGSDFRAGKVTYPLIHCWSRASEGERQTLRDIASRPTLGPEDVECVRGMVERSGALRATMDLVDGYLGRARGHLAAVADSPARHALEFMTEFVRARDW